MLEVGFVIEVELARLHPRLPAPFGVVGREAFQFLPRLLAIPAFPEGHAQIELGRRPIGARREAASKRLGASGIIGPLEAQDAQAQGEMSLRRRTDRVSEPLKEQESCQLNRGPSTSTLRP